MSQKSIGVFLEQEEVINYPRDIFPYPCQIPGQYQLRYYSFSCVLDDPRAKKII